MHVRTIYLIAMATAVYDANQATFGGRRAMNDFERMIRQFLAHIDVERGLSKATVSAYGADLKKYRQWLANRGINDITSVTTQDVENYVAFLDESGEAARSKAGRWPASTRSIVSPWTNIASPTMYPRR